MQKQMQTRALGTGKLDVSALGFGCMGAHAVHPVTALQSEYSLWWRAP